MESIEQFKARIDSPGCYVSTRGYRLLHSFEFDFDLDQVTSGNLLYKPQQARDGRLYLTLTREARWLKRTVGELAGWQVNRNKLDEIEAETKCMQTGYWFGLPLAKLDTKAGKVRNGFDLTNLTKILEDAVFDGLDSKLKDGIAVLSHQEKHEHDGDGFKVLVKLSCFGK